MSSDPDPNTPATVPGAFDSADGLTALISSGRPEKENGSLEGLLEVSKKGRK